MLSLTRPIEFNQPNVGGLRDLAPLAHRARLPRWIAIIIVMVLATILWWLARDRQPEALSEAHLTGYRSPAAVSVVVLLDESGSFANYDHVRHQVLDQLVEWAPDNLLPHDLITVVSFAGSADIKLATTSVAEFGSAPPTYRSTSTGNGTEIQPALRLLTERAEVTSAPISLVAVTDTEISDADPHHIAQLVTDLGATTMSVITPTQVTDSWRDAFPWQIEIVADARSAKQTALAVGEAFAHATGQQLEAR